MTETGKPETQLEKKLETLKRSASEGAGGDQVAPNTKKQHLSNESPSAASTTSTAAANLPVPLTIPTDEDLNSMAKEPFTSQQVIDQVEFYFGDNNLTKDKFLYRTVQANPEGWVAVSTIAIFNRMRKFRPVSAIVDSLKQSTLLEVNSSGDMIRRKTPLVVKDHQESCKKTIYARGFGPETATLQLEIEDYFSKFGKLKEVRLRRDKEKKFKNSVFVEFSNQSDADSYLENPNKPKFNGKDIVALSKLSYIAMVENNKKFGGNSRSRANSFTISSRNNSNEREKERRNSKSEKRHLIV